ncbi:two-component sensor histidine kinase [Secundilactobacillus paracollinoides]|uniref:histidine kinase n=1 Tax=Secundilactobacillus paracollinoides TaxID=240427 RepID=A0A1B2IXE2_9LACO|nr:HAMP domain-containing sensor histidine kinase [Secundilactobacillus paracollinoides]ANZ60843.1 two-component sensor histidine kinase [Secundilactobacillus paracollinoides]ANZ65230.1 two-component sensor histidine kinase [Secundilactobacillus paracollinoides]ANZ66702.1 two-component sensor histidine kinase [Secundilactobacillus paracollinoides]
MAKLRQNSSAIMLRSFLFLVTLIILLSSLTTVVAVGHELLETSAVDSQHVINSLENTVIDGNDDWKNWRLNSTLDTSTSQVLVHNMRKDADAKYYYSPGTKRLLKHRQTKIPFIENLYYVDDTGFEYYNTGHAKGINYQLWMSLNDQVALLLRVVIVAIFILILTLFITPFYIKVISQRITKPLSALTDSAGTASTGNQQKSFMLPVPKRPTEVTDLANSFNRLLSQLYKQSEQEKLFISNAAHKLRTPIATIRSHAQLIQRRGKEHPEVIAKSVNYINDESHQMQSLVEELLSLSRADRAVLPLAPYDLSASLTEIADKMRPELQQQLTTVIPENIHITAHADSIEQIIINLLNNAGKYTPVSEPIQLVLSTTTNHVRIQVIDQGAGITDADKAHIFERFYRSSDIRGTIAGTGLGLAIASQLAELNHATLTVADNEPHGTIFSLTFTKDEH